MKNITIYYMLLFLISVNIYACKEENPTSLWTGGEAPGKVYDVEVINLPGGAKLKYKLPNSDNLLYVKAIYEYPKGTIREVKSSGYTDTLLIEGVGSVEEIEVKLYSVSRSEVISDPVTLSISPMTPPVHAAAASFLIQPDFGGIFFSFENLARYKLAITVMKWEEDEWKNLDVIYTNKEKGKVNIRGQEAQLTTFAAFAKDRWNNISDTIIVETIPLFEMQIPGPTPIYTLSSDFNLFYGGTDYSLLFDGNKTNGVETATGPTTPMPQSFTMDFGKPTHFSRFKYYMYPGGEFYMFNYASPERWEIWGSNTLQDDWSQWTKISNFTAVKPSGAPLGTMTAEDFDLAFAGLDFSFPDNMEPFRYLRWKTTRTFGGIATVGMAEITFFGLQL